MIQVSSQALDAFAARAEGDYVVRLAKFLQGAVPALAAETPSALIAETHRQVEKARHYGITSERGVASFAITAANLGAEFDIEFPAATACLNAWDIGEAAKVEWLESWTLQLFDELT